MTTVKQLQSDGAEGLGLTADVADRVAVDRAFAQIRQDLGPIEILVTSAGMSVFTPFAEITLREWNRVFEVNLTGTFHCSRAALPDMVASGWGRIITISSSSAGSPRRRTMPRQKAASWR